METMAGLWSMLADFSLINAFGITLQPLVIGLVISTILGVTIGVAMGLNDKAEWLASPIFIIAQAAPLAALIPLIVFAYGIGLTAKTLVVCIMAMPVIVLNSFAAVRHTPRLACRDGPFLPRLAPAGDPEGRAAGGEPGDLRRAAARLRRGLHRRDPRRAPHHADRRRRSHHLQPLHRATIPKMYAAILSIMVFSVLFIELIERVEVTLFRPEKRART